MTRLLAIVVGVALIVGIGWAGASRSSAQTRRMSTYEQITVSTSAVPIGAATLQGMAGCQIRVETAGVRYRQDTTAPTSSVGMPLNVGDVLLIDHAIDAANSRFIRSGSSNATLNVLCWPQ